MQSLRNANLKQHTFLKSVGIGRHSHGRRIPFFLPEYVRKRTPLLCAPQNTKVDEDDERKRFRRASLVTSTIVVLPLIWLWNAASSVSEFLEIITILPLLPVIFLATVVLPAICSFICMIYPGIIVMVVGGTVFWFAYVL